MRVLVCGGRDYDDRELVFIVLDRIHKETPIDAIIQGEASGADAFAREWTRGKDVVLIGGRADWKKHGRAAGPIRNQDMLDRWEPDMVLAFPGGRRTADMVDRARRAGVPVEHAARTAEEGAAALRDDLRRNRVTRADKETPHG